MFKLLIAFVILIAFHIKVTIGVNNHGVILPVEIIKHITEQSVDPDNLNYTHISNLRLSNRYSTDAINELIPLWKLKLAKACYNTHREYRDLLIYSGTLVFFQFPDRQKCFNAIRNTIVLPKGIKRSKHTNVRIRGLMVESEEWRMMDGDESAEFLWLLERLKHELESFSFVNVELPADELDKQMITQLLQMNAGLKSLILDVGSGLRLRALSQILSRFSRLEELRLAQLPHPNDDPIRWDRVLLSALKSSPLMHLDLEWNGLLGEDKASNVKHVIERFSDSLEEITLDGRQSTLVIHQLDIKHFKGVTSLGIVDDEPQSGPLPSDFIYALPNLPNLHSLKLPPIHWENIEDWRLIASDLRNNLYPEFFMDESVGNYRIAWMAGLRWMRCISDTENWKTNMLTDDHPLTTAVFVGDRIINAEHFSLSQFFPSNVTSSTTTSSPSSSSVTSNATPSLFGWHLFRNVEYLIASTTIGDLESFMPLSHRLPSLRILKLTIASQGQLLDGSIFIYAFTHSALKSLHLDIEEQSFVSALHFIKLILLSACTVSVNGAVERAEGEEVTRVRLERLTLNFVDTPVSEESERALISSFVPRYISQTNLLSFSLVASGREIISWELSTE